MKKKEKNRASIMSNTEELEYKIEIATQTLDRNLRFITNCDNKISIILAAVGVLLTIILTNEGINKISDIIKKCLEMKSISSILYLTCLAGVTVILIIGLFILTSALMAKIPNDYSDKKSSIFFAGINNYDNSKVYNDMFCGLNKRSLLNDLLEQIYINADIAAIKYKKYNCGVRTTMIGFALFVVVLIIGIYLY